MCVIVTSAKGGSVVGEASPIWRNHGNHGQDQADDGQGFSGGGHSQIALCLHLLIFKSSRTGCCCELCKRERRGGTQTHTRPHPAHNVRWKKMSVARDALLRCTPPPLIGTDLLHLDHHTQSPPFQSRRCSSLVILMDRPAGISGGKERSTLLLCCVSLRMLRHNCGGLLGSS